MSPCLEQVVNTFNLADSFRSLHTQEKNFSRYYGRAGQEAATRLDRSYHWGEVRVVEARYEAVAFSDHHAYLVELMMKMMYPKSRPVFNTSPEVVKNYDFRTRLVAEMVGWQEVKVRRLAILPWWELLVKPGMKRLAMERSKELKKKTRGRLNLLLMRQSYLISKIQAQRAQGGANSHSFLV